MSVTLSHIAVDLSVYKVDVAIVTEIH